MIERDGEQTQPLGLEEHLAAAVAGCFMLMKRAETLPRGRERASVVRKLRELVEAARARFDANRMAIDVLPNDGPRKVVELAEALQHLDDRIKALSSADA
jgi:hypothetical protein